MSIYVSRRGVIATVPTVSAGIAIVSTAVAQGNLGDGGSSKMTQTIASIPASRLVVVVSSHEGGSTNTHAITSPNLTWTRHIYGQYGGCVAVSSAWSSGALTNEVLTLTNSASGTGSCQMATYVLSGANSTQSGNATGTLKENTGADVAVTKSITTTANGSFIFGIYKDWLGNQNEYFGVPTDWAKPSNQPYTATSAQHCALHTTAAIATSGTSVAVKYLESNGTTTMQSKEFIYAVCEILRA